VGVTFDTRTERAAAAWSGCYIEGAPGGYRRSSLIEQIATGAQTTAQVRLLDACDVFTSAHVVATRQGFA
jgi:hypothetical protein